MYNSQFVCTYSYYDPALREYYHKDIEFDIEDVKEFEDMSEMIYQAELLQILGLSEAFKSNVNIEFEANKVIEIYDKIKTDAAFMECIEKVTQVHSYEDAETGFVSLFSYDYFFLTHKCICDFLTNEKIEDINIINLRNAIK